MKKISANQVIFYFAKSHAAGVDLNQGMAMPLLFVFTFSPQMQFCANMSTFAAVIADFF